MTDLEGEYYSNLLSQTVKRRLFHLYEKANWLIFLDAFPQLLLYEESKRDVRRSFICYNFSTYQFLWKKNGSRFGRKRYK